MTDIDALKARLTEAQRARAKAEHALDVARAQVASEGKRLQQEFGVTSVAEAHAMRQQLEADLAEAMAAMQSALDDIGA